MKGIWPSEDLTAWDSRLGPGPRADLIKNQGLPRLLSTKSRCLVYLDLPKLMEAARV